MLPECLSWDSWRLEISDFFWRASHRNEERPPQCREPLREWCWGTSGRSLVRAPPGWCRHWWSPSDHSALPSDSLSVQQLKYFKIMIIVTKLSAWCHNIITMLLHFIWRRDIFNPSYATTATKWVKKIFFSIFFRDAY